jgi:hypothetical protein
MKGGAIFLYETGFVGFVLVYFLGLLDPFFALNKHFLKVDGFM